MWIFYWDKFVHALYCGIPQYSVLFGTLQKVKKFAQVWFRPEPGLFFQIQLFSHLVKEHQALRPYIPKRSFLEIKRPAQLRSSTATKTLPTPAATNNITRSDPVIAPKVR